MTPETKGLICITITAICCIASAWETRRFYQKRRKLELEMAALRRSLINSPTPQPKIIDNRAGECTRWNGSHIKPVHELYKQHADSMTDYNNLKNAQKKHPWWEDVHTMD